LALAKLGSASDEVLPAHVCFHAQQTVEKALKALLVSVGRSYPPVHDLEQLLERLRDAGVDLPSWVDDLPELTPYATEARYPAYWEPITPGDQQRALELAERTLNWFRAELHPL
jgi:HEPN domain-containing protein